MNRTRLLGPLVLAGVMACSVVLYGDMEVYWTIEGSDGAGLCSTYNIGSWHVLADGPRRYSVDVDCQGGWNTGEFLWGVEEGYYDVTVEAIEVGSGSVLATQNQPRVRVLADAAAVTQVDLTFTASQFTGGGGVVNVYWNINGTEDGLPKGKSWDTCAEVGAAEAVVEVDGLETAYDCHAGGNMSAAVSVTAQPDVRVKLVDSAGVDLTTWSPLAAADPMAGAADTWEYVGEFFWDSFTTLKDTMTGDYWFTTTYEGQDCDQVTPTVKQQITLLKFDGTVVSPAPDVCGPDNVCTPSDGATAGSCYFGDETQKIVDSLWGEYTLLIQGAQDNLDVCWEKEFDIVIGAGATNPLVAHDLPRIDSSGTCTP
jgi:hypothetical protein